MLGCTLRMTRQILEPAWLMLMSRLVQENIWRGPFSRGSAFPDGSSTISGSGRNVASQHSGIVFPNFKGSHTNQPNYIFGRKINGLSNQDIEV